MARVARQLGGAFALDLDAAARPTRRRRPRSRARARPRRSRRPGRGSRSTRARARARSSDRLEHRVELGCHDGRVRRAALRPRRCPSSPCPVRMQTAVSPLPRPELRQRREPGRRGRLAERALLLREPVPGTAELVLRERHDLDPAGGDERRRRARRARARRSGSRSPTSSRARRPGRRRSARRARLLEPGGDRGHVAAAAEGQRDDVRARRRAARSARRRRASGPRSGRG